MTKLKTVDIKGKDYVEVNERITYFRQNYKDWCLTSEIIEKTDKSILIKGIVTDDKGVVRATGHALEVEGTSFINKTSHVENCETSAWGRALGNLGIGIQTSVASYEEVANAIKQQEDKKQSKATPKPVEKVVSKDRLAEMRSLAEKMNVLDKIKQECPDLSKMTHKRAGQIIQGIQARLEKEK